MGFISRSSLCTIVLLSILLLSMTFTTTASSIKPDGLNTKVPNRTLLSHYLHGDFSYILHGTSRDEKLSSHDEQIKQNESPSTLPLYKTSNPDPWLISVVVIGSVIVFILLAFLGFVGTSIYLENQEIKRQLHEYNQEQKRETIAVYSSPLSGSINSGMYSRRNNPETPHTEYSTL